MNVLAVLSLLSTSLLGSSAIGQSQDGQLATTPKKGEEVAVMETEKGQIVLMFFPEKAPKHVENFKSLAKKKFYDGTRFHRTIKDFMVQGGDPQSKDMSKSGLWGTGGNTDENGREKQIKAEFTDIKHVRGVLSMARSTNPDSASSQFFIMHKDSFHLDGQYSAFGRVVSGMDVVDKIISAPGGGRGVVKPSSAIKIKTVRIVKWPIKD